MSVPSKNLDRLRAKSERQKMNRAVRLVQAQDKGSEPIYAKTAGQSPETPHSRLHTDVFYVAGGEHFFVYPSGAQKSAPGERVRTTTPRSAVRKGLTWDEEDRKTYEASVEARNALTDMKYDIDPSTGALKNRDK